MSAKTYAMWGGIILLVLGVLGLFVQGDKFLGLNSDTVEDIIHVVAGLILVYFGFRGRAAPAAAGGVVFGVVFLVVGGVGFFIPKLFGLLPTGLGAIDNIVHLIYGAAGLWAVRPYKPHM